MLETLPVRSLFRFELSIHHLPKLPPLDGHVGKWESRYLLPALCTVDGQSALADVYAGWNDDGLMFAFDVPGRGEPFEVDEKSWWKGDGLRICVDTRDSRDLKRATRFCHFFYVLPTGGGRDGSAPVAGVHRMSRSKEPPPTVDPSDIRVALHATRRRWGAEVLLPASCLNGWSPAEQPRIGIYYKVQDLRLGAQHLTATDELGWNVDPSTWAIGVLVR